MIEERGHVLSVEDGAVWVETVRRSTCGSCSARAGCGQAMLQKLGSGARQGFVRVLSDSSHRVGDVVVIGVPENAVVRSSLLVYAVPLLGLFAFGLFTPWGVRDRWVPLVCVASPLVSHCLSLLALHLWGYHFGYELLLLNGLLTFGGLFAIKSLE